MRRVGNAHRIMVLVGIAHPTDTVSLCFPISPTPSDALSAVEVSPAPSPSLLAKTVPKSAGKVPEILTAHKFYLALTLDGQQDNVDGFFLECQGFKRTQDAIEIAEVTANKWGKSDKGQVVRTKIPGNVKSGNITLKRGMTNSQTIWKWFEAVQEGKWADQRKNASLSIYDQAGVEQARFELAGTWPASYKIADVNARSSDLEIEEIEVAFEEFKRVK